MIMRKIPQLLSPAALAWFIFFTVGCTNPYLAGFTGQANPPLGEGARVEVIGANRQDARSIASFDAAYAEAERTHRLLGSSTIVSGTRLRDPAAAEAGRELGATLVLYNFGYITSTVETDPTYPSYHRRNHGVDDHYHHLERSGRSSTKHWYEYRAYFFAR